MAEPLPDYCCAVIVDTRRWLLLQLRPQGSALAPGQLTCFGGRRETDEGAEACLARELAEELGWTPRATAPCCELWRGASFIARFYRTSLDTPPGRLRTEAGHRAIFAPWPALPGLPLSPWHALVLMAVAAGRERVELE